MIPNVEQTADIFKLNIDCFETLFDYLTIDQLIAIGETCKRLRRIAGHCYRENYPFTPIYVPSISDDASEMRKSFSQFSQNIRISIFGNTPVDVSKHSCHKSLRNVHFQHFTFSVKTVEHFKGILDKADSLTLSNCIIKGEAYDILLRHCGNVKHLQIRGSTPLGNGPGVIFGSSNHWLNRIYPNLEHFELSYFVKHLKELTTFLELNPTIRKLKIGLLVFRYNINDLIDSDIKLDILNLNLDFYQLLRGVKEPLNILHEDGFYEKLHFNVSSNNQAVIDELAPINGIVKLNIRHESRGSIVLPGLINLENLVVVPIQFRTGMISHKNVRKFTGFAFHAQVLT